MSYAIIRNTKYKRENLRGIFRHNERRNKNYSNENIDREKSYLNYSLKFPQYSYEKEFDRIKEKYNLKGQIKTVSNIACEYIITSDHDYFERVGEKETKRFFETAYKFVVEYKNLGEQYIMSAKVHMDEQTPHMHLIFLPVVHTIDKKGNAIDKLACSEFWKAKDSYRQLQDAFYKYMVENGFNLQRGLPKEETGREHYSVEEYKKITNFKQTKEILNNMKLELPDIPDITDININRLSKKRDEKILEEIIKPKDNVIQNLYQDNMNLHRQLSRQAQVIEQAENSTKDKINLKNSLSDISHQLKTPLTSIMIMLDNLIENPDLDGEIRNDFVKEIKVETTNINFLVQSILKLSQLDSNTVEYFNKKIKLSELVEKSIKKIQPLCDLKNIKVDINVIKDSEIVCDEMWQVEAISNIVKNCVEHSKDEGKVDVSINVNNVYSQIIIKDNGVGISKKDLPHIFERFYKGKNSTNTSIGIGLALSKMIINKCNGTIQVESEEGKGTFFIIKYFK